MAKMYTLDSKLLCGSPEIRIGDKVFPIDDRQKTVKKVLKLFNKQNKNNDIETTEAAETDELDNIDEILKLAFGKSFKEIDALNLSFAAYQELVEIVIAAMTGEDEDEFRKKKAQAKQEEKGQSFPESDGNMV